jgi:hypothetical protein
MRMKALAAMLFVVALSAGCHHPKRVADAEQERIDRLTRRLVPLLVTDGFGYASATGDCGPADHPAMALYLLDSDDDTIPSKPNPKYIHVRVYLEPASLAHERVQWSSSAGPGVAELCSEGSCYQMTSGSIVFGKVKQGKSVEGELDLRFTNHVRVRKTFHAHWLQTDRICP